MHRKLIASALAVSACAGLVALSPATATAAHIDSYTANGSTHRGFGFDYEKAAVFHAGKPAKAVKVGNPQAVRTVSTAPASYSLKSYALSPGDQGQVGSCVAWATGYSAYGLLMKEQGLNGAPMAPMFIYAQIAKGNDQGTWASVALPMEQQQGIDTKAHYWQGDFDYTTQPDAAERTNAAQYKLSGYTDLTNTDRVTTIKNAIASGLPVAIGFRVKNSFYNVSAGNDIYVPKGKVVGGHEVTIVGYDANYVTIENSWGTGWGNAGFFRMSWSTITSRDVDEVHSVGKLVPAV
jgi:C1A family cysteine protease